MNGDDLSLMQHAYERAKKLTDKIYVATEASHVQHVKDQLSDLPAEAFIVEPGRRGTAHCIVAALAEIGKRENADEPIAFIHADHYIRDVKGFAHSFKIAEKTSRAERKIVLVGVEPDYPATGFGYIQKGDVIDDATFVCRVTNFKEKPDFETAKKYLRSGNYLWNGGYFVGSVSTFQDTMRQDAPDLFASYQKLVDAAPDTYDETYLSFENIAIDYALIEKVKNLLVVPASFDWMDLGSFKDMYEAVEHDGLGNHVMGQKVATEEVESSFIQNYEDKPLAVIGLDNVVVVNTPHGLLVARKDLSQKVGDVSKRLNAKS